MSKRQPEALQLRGQQVHRFRHLAFVTAPPPDLQIDTRTVHTGEQTWYPICLRSDRSGQACRGLTGATIITPEDNQFLIERVEKPLSVCANCPKVRSKRL
jgi:hypothetical protein